MIRDIAIEDLIISFTDIEEDLKNPDLALDVACNPDQQQNVHCTSSDMGLYLMDVWWLNVMQEICDVKGLSVQKE